jgi:hypothetical protein
MLVVKSPIYILARQRSRPKVQVPDNQHNDPTAFGITCAGIHCNRHAFESPLSRITGTSLVQNSKIQMARGSDVRWQIFYVRLRHRSIPELSNRNRAGQYPPTGKADRLACLAPEVIIHDRHDLR